MYNKYLDIFICVADAGSFSKASRKLFVSPNAVMKQINILEDELAVKLFVRSNHGLELTPAGRLIYQDARRLIAHSAQTLAQARALMSADHQQVIRIGSSLMRPSRKVVSLWQKVGQRYPQFKLKIISFDDQHDNYRRLVTHLGQKIDVISGIYPSDLFGHRCSCLQLGWQKISVAVPLSHHLAGKKELQPSDLNGEKVVIIKHGDTKYIDRLRTAIERHHPQIKLITVDNYDVDTLNYCEKNNLIMITTTVWKDIHPTMATIPVDWAFRVPYGILYPLHPSPPVKTFINAIKAVKN